MVKRLSHTVPHVLLTHISTLPLFVFLLPNSLTTPVVQSTGAEINIFTCTYKV